MQRRLSAGRVHGCALSSPATPARNQPRSVCPHRHVPFALAAAVLFNSPMGVSSRPGVLSNGTFQQSHVQCDRVSGCPPGSYRFRRGPIAPSALRPSSSSSSASSSETWSPNPVELVRREAGLQSNRLDPKLRERVETAVERLGGRVTVGDVAARAGVKLAEADEMLKALAYDTQASLKVSSDGEIVYGFAPDFRSRLRNRSLLVRALPLLRRAAGVLGYLTRVAFGSALIVSVVVVWLAILALMRGGRDGDRDDRRGGYSSGYQTYHSTRMFMDVTDLFLYWDPAYYRTTADRVARGQRLNFVESIFSFVFGDGDPNADFEERRWQRLGEMIRAKGGVVTAEELAPYLDPPEPAPQPSARSSEPYVPYPDESFVLPALIKFCGEPVVDEEGRILYRFPALQLTGVKQQRGFSRFNPKPTFDIPLEKDWDFTAASSGQIMGTVFLGVLNVVGVAVLSSMLADRSAAYLLAAQGLGWVAALLGPLQLYAAAFFAIPAFRWFLNASKNRAIDERNETRALAADLLNSGSSSVVEGKVAAARDLAAEQQQQQQPVARLTDGGSRMRLGPRVVGDDEIVFDSGKEAELQAVASEQDDWDQRLAGEQGRRGGAGGSGGAGTGRAGGWRGRR